MVDPQGSTGGHASNVARGRPAIVLLLAVLLPVLVFVVIIASVIVGEARADAEKSALASARAIMMRVDAEVSSDIRALTAVAQSVKGVAITQPRPTPERARYNAELFPQWLGMLVWSKQSRASLFSTLPSPDLPEIPDAWAVEGGTSDDVVIGEATNIDGVPAALLHRSVPEDARGLMLTLAVRAKVFQTILMSELPEGAIGAIVDRQGNFLARSVDIEKRFATPATFYVRDAITSAPEGIYRGRTYEGFENYTAYYTSPATGWSAHVAISNTLVDNPRSLSLLVALVGGLLCIGLTGGLIFLVAEDSRRRRQAETMLTQAQKLETLGLLTGGIAHDFNNMLTVIMGSLERLKRTVAGPESAPDAQAAIEAAMSSSRRAAGLTRSLLAYSRQQTLALRVIDPNVFVKDMTEVVARTLGEPFDIQSEMDDQAGPIEVDDNQLGSAILNLAVNARDAMPDGGTITFATHAITIAQSERMLGLTAGDYVRISVKDTGPGMAPTVAAKAFEPFFTTKGIGQGTGLGLAQVEGFIRQSGGAVELETALGKGTAIHLYLPRTLKTTLQSDHDTDTNSLLARPPALRVLLVEDEADVRSNAVDLLREQGHEVTSFATAREALDRTTELHFDLLFTDVVLPGDMNGVQLAEAMRRRQKDIRVLLTTGYARDTLRDGAADVVLAKPYGREDLMQKVEEAMQRRLAGAPDRILLVEDEPLIRLAAVEALQDCGFEAVEAASAAEALTKFDENPESFALAVIDLGLPDKPGDQLAIDLASRHPELPVLIASGQMDTNLLSGTAVRRFRYLQKPYTPDQLLQQVRGLTRDKNVGPSG